MSVSVSMLPRAARRRVFVDKSSRCRQEPISKGDRPTISDACSGRGRRTRALRGNKAVQNLRGEGLRDHRPDTRRDARAGAEPWWCSGIALAAPVGGERRDRRQLRLNETVRTSRVHAERFLWRGAGRVCDIPSARRIVRKYESALLGGETRRDGAARRRIWRRSSPIRSNRKRTRHRVSGEGILRSRRRFELECGRSLGHLGDVGSVVIACANGRTAAGEDTARQREMTVRAALARGGGDWCGSCCRKPHPLAPECGHAARVCRAPPILSLVTTNTIQDEGNRAQYTVLISR